jgi:hypothetical protein
MPEVLTYDPSNSTLSTTPSFRASEQWTDLYVIGINRHTRVYVDTPRSPYVKSDDRVWLALTESSLAEDWDSPEDSVYDQL